MLSRQTRPFAVASFIATVFLSACGGSSGPGSSDQQAQSEQSAPTLTNSETDLLTRINTARAAGATCGTTVMPSVNALQWDNQLEQAALGHSQYMQVNNLFDHAGAGGSSVGSRVTDTGFVWSTVAENIAAGQPDNAAVIQAWLNSPGHCTNLMAPGFTEVAVTLVDGNASNTYSTYWTMVLATPR